MLGLFCCLKTQKSLIHIKNLRFTSNLFYFWGSYVTFVPRNLVVMFKEAKMVKKLKSVFLNGVGKIAEREGQIKDEQRPPFCMGIIYQPKRPKKK